MEAKLDGFRMYKIKNRGDASGDRKYIAPVYVCGLPGDVAMLNKELKDLGESGFESLVKIDGKLEQRAIDWVNQS